MKRRITQYLVAILISTLFVSNSFAQVQGACKTTTLDSTGFDGLFCLANLCRVDNASKGPNGNDADSSVFHVAAGLAANQDSAYQYSKFGPVTCLGDTITVIVSNADGSVLDPTQLGQLRLELRKGDLKSGTIVKRYAGDSPNVNAVALNGKNILKFAATGAYDGFKLVLYSNPSGVNDINYFNVCARGGNLPELDSTNSQLLICYATKGNLTVKVPSGTYAEWYSGPVGGLPLSSTGPSTFTTPVLTATTTFYVQTVKSGCSSGERTAVTVTVRPQVATPTFSTSNPLTVCKGTGATLNAVTVPSTTTEAQWFSLGGTTILSQGNSFNTPTINSDSVVYEVRTITKDALACTSNKVTYKVYGLTQKNGPLFLSCIDNDGPEIVTFQWDATQFANYLVSEDNGTTYYSDNIDGVKGKEVIELGTQPPYPKSATIYVRAITGDACGVTKESRFTCENKDCETYYSNPQYVYSSNFFLPDAKVQFLENTNGADAWAWTFKDEDGNVVATSNEQNPVITFTKEGIIKAELIVTKGSCVSQMNSTSVQIFPSPFVTFPTAFTPNGDGTNDEFGPVAAGLYTTEYEFRVYNQWGQEVFLTSDITKKWNGKFNGEDQPEGVYIYKLKSRLIDQVGSETRTGSFNLIR